MLNGTESRVNISPICFANISFLIFGTYVNEIRLPIWHSQYPSEMDTYTKSGYLIVIITGKDTTEADVRPKKLLLPANLGDSDERCALVGKHSSAFGRLFTLD